MREVESHTEDFLSLCPVAKQLADKYKPSDVLDQMMVELTVRWEKYVKTLTKRYVHYVAIVYLQIYNK